MITLFCMFLKISILEWFRKDHVTPKTGKITGKKYVLKYIQIENYSNYYIKINCNTISKNITIFTVFLNK